MPDRKCPVSIADIFQAEFKPFDHGDWETFAGVEGDGYIAMVIILGESYQVVLDHGSDSEVQVHYINEDTGKYQAWLIPIGPTVQIL